MKKIDIFPAASPSVPAPEITKMSRYKIEKLIWRIQTKQSDEQGRPYEWPEHLVYIHTERCRKNGFGRKCLLDSIYAPNTIFEYRGHTAELSNMTVKEIRFHPKTSPVFIKGKLELQSVKTQAINTRDIGTIIINNSEFSELNTDKMGLFPMIAIDKTTPFQPSKKQAKAYSRGQNYLEITSPETMMQENKTAITSNMSVVFSTPENQLTPKGP